MNTAFLSTTRIHRSLKHCVLFLILLVLICFAFFQRAEAVTPPPDGGYPGGNTAEGQSALLGLSTGIYNTAVGFLSLSGNTDESFNTAIGAGALISDTGSGNTATGAGALLTNIGVSNTANGAFALFQNIQGGNNTANGWEALFNNTNGFDNTASGFQALFSNEAGSFNTGIGFMALVSNISGSDNIALGDFAGSNVATASNVICIGAPGDNVDNTCYIGSIRDVQTQNADALPVVIDSAGQLGTASSSRRFKNEIKPMDKSSEAILGLKPVTFHYKSDQPGTPQFGLIAEDVAKVNPDLVVRDKNGEIYTVRYDAVNAMLLNEFLKEHRKVEQLKKEFESKIAEQQRQIEALASGLEKMNARFEPSKPTAQVALKDQ